MDRRHRVMAARGPEFVIPYVIEETPRGERSSDVYSRLLRDRIIFLGTGVNDQVANAIVAQLVFLAAEDPKKEISMYINSPGGQVYSGLAIYDTMQYIPCDVATYCVGMAASMGALLLMAGTPGKRSALPHSRVLIHQGSSGFQGAIPDIEVMARETLRLSATTTAIMAKHTGQSYEKIQRDTMRDYYLTPQEAKEYGIIDTVIGEDELPDNVAAKEIAAEGL